MLQRQQASSPRHQHQTPLAGLRYHLPRHAEIAAPSSASGRIGTSGIDCPGHAAPKPCPYGHRRSCVCSTNGVCLTTTPRRRSTAQWSNHTCRLPWVSWNCVENPVPLARAWTQVLLRAPCHHASATTCAPGARQHRNTGRRANRSTNSSRRDSSSCADGRRRLGTRRETRGWSISTCPAPYPRCNACSIGGRCLVLRTTLPPGRQQFLSLLPCRKAAPT